MSKKKWRLQFGLRLFFGMVTIAAIVSWYFRPPPTAEELAGRLLKAKHPREIPSLLRQTKHLTGHEIRKTMLGALDPDDDVDNRGSERDYFFSKPNLEKLYVGCRQWAIDKPAEVQDWIEHEIRQKDISGLYRHESALLAVLTGFTEGIARHDLDKAFEVEYGIGWGEDSWNAVTCGLYFEFERRSVDELTHWCDSLWDRYDTGFIVVDDVKQRVAKEDPEKFIAWLEDDSNPDLFEWREPRNSVAVLASHDIDRAIEWIGDLEKRRSDPSAEMLLGYYGDAYISVANQWCERDRYEFIDWAMTQLRENPTDEIYISWHRAICEMAYEWPDRWSNDDLRYVEKAVFMLDGGAVNFPGIAWYLYHLPDAKVIELSENWLGDASPATEEQKDGLRKAFGHAMIFVDKVRARKIVSQLKDKEMRRRFLAGVEAAGRGKGTDWWMHWRHDVGIRRVESSWDDHPRNYEDPEQAMDDIAK